MSASAILILAMVVDALVGEPAALWRRVPHPAVVMGNIIRWCDQRFNTPTATTRTAGTLVVLALVLCAGAVGSLLSLFGPVVEVLVLAILLAQRSLVDHVRAVATGLRMSLAEGRQAVAMIVSRDTADMEKSAIARSAIESGAENMSDGVIAPAFWFLVGGLPGLLIYKIVNTGDSMIGYRTPRHEHFGWAAARLDDLLNLIPARLTAVLIALPGGVIGDWRAISADARLHKSPNAGWPEAAMARAIHVALAGPRAYDGVMQPFAWVNEDGQRDLDAGHIDAAVKRLWQAWAMMLVLLLCVMMF